MLTRADVYCPVCGSRRIRLIDDTGACPLGHQPDVPGFTFAAVKQYAKAERWEVMRARMALPKAKVVLYHWIDGVGVVEWVRQANRYDLPSGSANGEVMARCGTRYIGIFRKADLGSEVSGT